MYKNNNIRQSNFELLRILCMLGVMVNHALSSCYELHTTDFTMANNLRIVILDASIVAVNCFVLISGYFRIKQSWKGFYVLYTQMLFYAVVAFVIEYFISGETSVQKGLTTILFPLTANGLWFIHAYFALYLLAPLLNAALDNQDGRARKMTLLMLILVDVYIGYMHQIEEVSVNGCHLIHFVTLYYIGANLKDFKAKRVKWGGGVLLLIILGAGLHAIKMIFPPIAIVYSMRYNSPYVMVASVCLFQWIATFRFQLGIINKIAKSVLAAYIMHSMIPHYYWGLHWVQDHTGYLGTVVMMPLFIVVYFIMCILIDQLRIVICQPLNSFLADRTENTFDLS